jgi:hypothetical protein
MRKANGASSENVIARRLLQARGRKTVEVIIRKPELATKKPEEWSCIVDIRGSAEITEPIVGHGLDSLQSLLTALQAARNALRRDRTLTWLGSPREIGFPLMISEEDPDFVTLVESLLEAEFSRMILSRKRARKRPRTTRR